MMTPTLDAPGLRNEPHLIENTYKRYVLVVTRGSAAGHIVYLSWIPTFAMGVQASKQQQFLPSRNRGYGRSRQFDFW